MLVIASLAVGGVLAVVVNFPSSPCSKNPGVTSHFTIVADVSGFNGSRYQPGSWPIITVHACDTVFITIVNSDTQTHGFAVEYYASNGVEVQGRQSQTVQFVAARTGQFRMFCNVFCTVHIYMQNGLLSTA